jgi:hypothetical protein
MKNLINYLASLFGVYFSFLIEKKKLKNFFHKLKPYQTNFRLIRLGNNHDGGYLIPDDLKNLNFCFSCGVGKNISFEQELLKKKKIEFFFADGTVDRLPITHKNFNFIKKNISNISNSKNFSINQFIKKKKKDKDYILKIDIEGHEYKAIIDIERKYLKEARIIIIEFHYINRILRSCYYDLIEYCFNKILETHVVVHMHPNNDGKSTTYRNFKIFNVLEITFLRKDRFFLKKNIKNFTNILDFQTNPNKKPLFIPNNYFN